MQVKILEERLSSTDSDGRHHLLSRGDIITVPDDTGADWCAHGWAEDVAGGVATGERVVEGATLKVDKAAHTQNSPEV